MCGLCQFQRIVRNSEISGRVKKLHDWTCQICGTRIAIPSDAYAEGAHIRPLGRPHDGPDVEENVLCLCPNDHVRFEFGAIVILTYNPKVASVLSYDRFNAFGLDAALPVAAVLVLLALVPLLVLRTLRTRPALGEPAR